MDPTVRNTHGHRRNEATRWDTMATRESRYARSGLKSSPLRCCYVVTRSSSNGKANGGIELTYFRIGMWNTDVIRRSACRYRYAHETLYVLSKRFRYWVGNNIGNS